MFANNWGYLKTFSEKEKLENVIALRIFCYVEISDGQDDVPHFSL